ncbi:MSHA fimbrial biogenesis protein MshG [soil metagenome]
MAFRAPQKALLYGELAKLVQAGFGIDKAADTILHGDPPRAQEQFADGLKSGLEQGKSIADSIRALDLPISELEIGLVEAGEKGGRLEDAFAHLANYFEMLDRTGRQVRARMIYPFVLLHAAIILPAIPLAVFPDGGGVHGFLFDIVTKFAIFYGLAALVTFAWIATSRAARTQAAPDRLLDRIPMVGKVRRSLAFARFCRVFKIYLLSGQRMDDGFRAAAAASASGAVFVASEDVVASIRRGDPIGPELVANPAFPKSLARSLLTAEEAGTLDTDLHRWSILMEANASEALEQLGAWLPKIIYAIVVLFVLYQIFAMASAYFGQITGLMDSI